MAGTQTPRGDAAILDKYRQYILSAASQYGVDPVYIGGIILHESSGVPGITNPSGASGLMQVLPSANKQYDVKKLRGTSASDIQYQINAGTEILSKFLKQANGNTTAAFQGYAGTGYKGPNGISFLDELKGLYFPAVSTILGTASDGSGDTGVSSGDTGGVTDHTFVQNVTDVITFFSKPESYLRIALFAVGSIVLIGGLYLVAKEVQDNG